MAALPYIQLYVADYLADTAHLNAAQHGAYLLLILNYWQRGKPLNNANDRLANVARMSNEEWQQNKADIAEFFVIDGDTWTHKRIEADLEAVSTKSTKSSDAGKASAAAKKAKKEQLLNERSTDVEQDSNERSTDVEQPFNHKEADTDTDTDTETESEKTKRVPRFDAQAHLMSLDIPADLSADWIKLRKAKKAEVTKTAIDGVAEEATKAGITLEAALRECCIRGWAGIKASWLARDSANQRASPVIPLEARNKAVADKWVPPEMREQA